MAKKVHSPAHRRTKVAGATLGGHAFHVEFDEDGHAEVEDEIAEHLVACDPKNYAIVPDIALDAKTEAEESEDEEEGFPGADGAGKPDGGDKQPEGGEKPKGGRRKKEI